MNKRNVRRALTRGFKLIFAGALAVFMMAAPACDSGSDDGGTEEEKQRVFTDELERVEPDENLHFTMAAVGDGFDVFAPV